MQKAWSAEFDCDVKRRDTFDSGNYADCPQGKDWQCVPQRWQQFDCRRQKKQQIRNAVEPCTEAAHRAKPSGDGSVYHIRYAAYSVKHEERHGQRRSEQHQNRYCNPHGGDAISYIFHLICTITYILIQHNNITAVKIDRQYLISKESLKEYCKRNKR